ncbi:TRAP transporter small permease subunit [Amaricoccus sp.]|uniref:TRAP transporter small permease subunit n=1 Tax=Amaricoccus sp. TaxID=1872485 RepID=UPI00260E8B64|nr:TRAP transporter small permease subunit [Amaricoccus sp.]HRO10463.1 TRAP transporter small permease subunit [Amaricoccus sp.]
MPRAILLYVRWVGRISAFFGHIAMYLVFAMIGVLLWSAFMRTGFNRPPLWSVEMSQFLLAAYYILGGGYTLQLDSHVRMDLLYSRWTPRKRAFADTITSLCLITYLVVMLWGGVSSTQYALEYGQRAATSWRPYMAPIKIIMTFGIFLMLLQTVAFFFRDLARVRGREIE